MTLSISVVVDSGSCLSSFNFEIHLPTVRLVVFLLQFDDEVHGEGEVITNSMETIAFDAARKMVNVLYVLSV